jgi:hypothetical protein
MEWTEQIITSRDNTLSKIDREIQFYRKTWTGKMLMAARPVLRKFRKFLR